MQRNQYQTNKHQNKHHNKKQDTKINHTEMLAQQRRQQEYAPTHKEEAIFGVTVTPKRKSRNKKPQPRFAISQHSTEQAQLQHITLMSSLLFIRTMDKKQIMSLCFLALICGGYATSVLNDIQKNPRNKENKKSLSRSPEEKEKLKKEIYQQVCQDTSKITMNKPDITLGCNNNGVMEPKACIEKSTVDCHAQMEQWKRFIYDHSIIGSERDKEIKMFDEWEQFIEPQLETIYSRQTALQNKAFDEILSPIMHLKQMYLTSIWTRQLNAGNCGEHSRTALMELLNKKLQYGLEMKIQLISMIASESSHAMNGHQYLLLESNIDEISIHKDRASVKQVIDKMEGTICDPWNHGYYADFKTDNSGLYGNNAGWDTLKVQTFSLKFAGFNKVSMRAQQFICKLLAEIGLNVEPRDACRMFRKKTTPTVTSPSNEENIRQNGREF